MSPFQITIIHVGFNENQDCMYRVTVCSMLGEYITDWTVTKEEIPDTLAQYLCVGKYTV